MDVFICKSNTITKLFNKPIHKNVPLQSYSRHYRLYVSGPNAMAGVSAIAAASLRSSDNVLSGHLAGTPIEIREENQVSVY